VIASQRIFLAITRLAPSSLVLTHSGDLSDRAENSNAYVRAGRCVALAAEQLATNVNLSKNALYKGCNVVTGKTIMSDICSVTSTTGFHEFTFSAHYGFGGNILGLSDKYKTIGMNKPIISMFKGLTKSKLRLVL